MSGYPDGLAAALAQRVDGEVRFDAGSRAAYATDASNYRQVPIGWYACHRPPPAAGRGQVALWPDTFTNSFHPEAGKAAVAVLAEEGWRARRPPDSPARKAIAQVHCHQHAVIGFDADTEVLKTSGVEVTELDTGCCGLAGNFGFGRGHYEVSVGCAQRGLWPAVTTTAPGTAILADGFSCRTQIEAGRLGRQGMHLAQVLAAQAGLAASGDG